MKVNKIFSIDIEMAKELDELPNRSMSKLINDLLREHFSVQWAKALPPEQLSKRIALLEQKQAIDKELEEQMNVRA